MTMSEPSTSAHAEPVVVGASLACSKCGSAEDLVLESVGPVLPRRSGMIALEYSCGTCESFYAPASSLEIAGPFTEAPVGVQGMLQRGSTRRQCGQPIREKRLQISVPSGEEPWPGSRSLDCGQNRLTSFEQKH